jgi:antitoxin ParD1/3/4
MANTSLNISLPVPLKKYVEAAAKAGDYSTPSEYVRELIREDNKRRREALENELIEAMKGPSYSISHADLHAPDFFERLERKLMRKPAKGKSLAK